MKEQQLGSHSPSSKTIKFSILSRFNFNTNVIDCEDIAINTSKMGIQLFVGDIGDCSLKRPFING